MSCLEIDKTSLFLARDKKSFVVKFEEDHIEEVCMCLCAKLILREHASLMRGRDLYAKRSIPTCTAKKYENYQYIFFY